MSKIAAKYKEKINFKFFITPWGMCLYAFSCKGLCAIFLGENKRVLEAQLAGRFPEAEFEEVDEFIAFDFQGALLHPFNGILDARGTPFQKRVWDAMREIPFGKTCSYKELAKQIGSPGSVRAVAGACGANPIAGIIPCHRVIRSDGELSGYRWGKSIKEQLLKWEKSHAAKT